MDAIKLPARSAKYVVPVGFFSGIVTEDEKEVMVGDYVTVYSRSMKYEDEREYDKPRLVEWDEHWLCITVGGEPYHRNRHLLPVFKLVPHVPSC